MTELKLNVVLLEPEIPANTGNVSRTCAALGAKLHLIGPMGFSVDEKQVKRAGLDYWPHLALRCYDNLQDFVASHPEVLPQAFFFSAHANKLYTEPKFQTTTWLVFGKESVGLPQTLVQQHFERSLRIPTRAVVRSLNLSNAVALACFEFFRQHDFGDLELKGPPW